MNTFINENGALNFLLNDLEAQTKRIKEEIRKIDEMLSNEPEAFHSRIEKLEYKTKMFDLINKRNVLAFNLSLLDSNKRRF